MELALVIVMGVTAFIFRGIIKIKVSSLEKKVMVSVTEDDIAIAKDAIRLVDEINALPQDKERDIFKVHDMITKAVAKPTVAVPASSTSQS